MVESDGLENRCRLTGDRGFESHPLRQLEKERFSSPSARARQPILKQKLNFLSLFCEAKRQKRAFLHFWFDEIHKIC